MIMNLY